MPVMHRFSSPLTSLLGWAAAAVALASGAVVGAANPAARLMTYEKAPGETYFALSLTTAAAPSSDPRDVLVVVDTSASQVGAYRDDAIMALRQMLSQLGKEDRVMLAAADLKVVVLTEGFVAADSPEMKQGLETLERRVPLGATDMEVIFQACTEKFTDASRPRVALYIGDGMSKANFIPEADMQAQLAKLVEREVSFSAYAIGPETEIQLLGGAANATGGMLAVDGPNFNGHTVGMMLAKVVRATVAWPVSATLPKGFVESFPAPIPPLRSDRDTVVYGLLSSRGPHAIRVAARQDGKPAEYNWTVAAEKSSDDLVYLPQLVELARTRGAVSLPTLGLTGLNETGKWVFQATRDLTRLGSQALAGGDLDGAERLAKAALERDPNDPEAKAIVAAVLKTRGVKKPGATPVKRTAYQPPPGADPAAPPPAPAAPPAAAPGAAPGAGSFLEEVKDELGAGLELFNEGNKRAVQTQIIKSEVEDSLKRNRDLMATQPDVSQANLKLMLENVERAPDLDVGVKAQLRDQLETAIRTAAQRKIVKDAQDQVAAEAKANAVERQRRLDALERRQDKLRQIMERFGSLMEEGRYAEASSLARDQAVPLDTQGVTSNVAVVSSQTTGAFRQFMAVNAARQRNWLETMYQVERSHVPFPDEPPITYPDPEVWQELTLRRKKYASIDLAKRGGAEEKIFAELDNNTKLEFVETPLNEVIDYLKDLHQIEIQIDEKALKDVGIDSKTAVTKNLSGISLRSALRLMLKEMDLTYVIRDEVLLITTPEEANAKLVTKVYPVADLVLPINSGAGANPFMLGGGLGGQGGFGGGMGGNMGGGMGGMGNNMGGNGFGGMGGMGGGGGFFDVVDEPARIGHAPKGFQAWAVDEDLRLGAPRAKKEEDLKIGGEKPAAPAVIRPNQPAEGPAVVKPAPAKIEKIVLEKIPGQTTRAAWEAHFAKHPKTSPESVREAVREMMKDEKNPNRFKDVVECLEATLLAGHPQPWMYEAMALALQAQDAPADQIERTVMSAVDFSPDVESLMFAAAYLERIGLQDGKYIELQRRALKLFREAAQANPIRPEPYMRGLEIAKRINDEEGIRWACLGVLRQAWSRKQRDIEQQAFRTAAVTLAGMSNGGKSEDARKFESDLDLALARDVVVKVTWTGDADIDLLVEEPSGTVCSMRNDRTTAGGVLVDDAFAKPTANVEGTSETYICPEAFNGTYRVLLRRIWGRPSAGRVSVDVYTGYRTKHEVKIHKEIPLGDKDALVLFDVTQGRRKESLIDSQIANAADAQLAVGRAILSQQLNALSDASTAYRDFAADRQQAGRDGRIGPRIRGPVGYRPVITTLPEGANMTATAVISADRRYVRITAVPLFSQVGDVVVFSLQSGVVQVMPANMNAANNCNMNMVNMNMNNGNMNMANANMNNGGF